MEIEELKGVWAEYDKKLNESLKLNEELLKKNILDKSNREMKTPLNYEIGSIVITSILFLFLAVTTYRFRSEIKFLIPGVVASLLTLLGFISSVRKVNIMSGIDYYNSPVIELQKSINNIKQKAIKSRKIEYLLFPVYFISFAPIFDKGVYNIDLFDKSQILIIGALASMIIY